MFSKRNIYMVFSWYIFIEVSIFSVFVRFRTSETIQYYYLMQSQLRVTSTCYLARVNDGTYLMFRRSAAGWPSEDCTEGKRVQYMVRLPPYLLFLQLSRCCLEEETPKKGQRTIYNSLSEIPSNAAYRKEGIMHWGSVLWNPESASNILATLWH